MTSISPATKLRVLGSGALAITALGLAWLGLSTVDSSWWIARDDAVITFSHARNLIEFGTVGVSPGDRVEGFSSPLQFLLAAGILAVSDQDFPMVSLLIIVACLVTVGACSFLFLDRVAERAGFDPRMSARIAALTGVVFLVGVTSHWTVLGWVASGMENAPALALLLAMAASFPLLRRGGMWPVIPSVVLGLLAITRVEFVAFIAPLSALFVVELLEPVGDDEQGPPRGAHTRSRWIRIASGLAPGLTLVAGIHLLRRLHFGTWLPNTAVVQDRFDGASQIILLVQLCATFTFTVLLVRATNRKWLRGMLGTLVALTVTTYAWMTRSGDVAVSPRRLIAVLFDFPGLILVIGLALVLTRILSRVGTVDRPSLALLWALLFIPVGQFVIMGPARMDPYRVLSLALPIVLLWLSVVVIGLSAVARTMAGETGRPGDARRVVAGVAWLLFLGVGLAGLSLDRPRDLPWEIADYTQIQQAAEHFRETNLGPTSLPIVANPDLGKLSFQKEMLMVDLGWLGDPLLTTLWKQDRNLAIEYIERVARPDVVELHGPWSCSYRRLLESSEFRENYTPTSGSWMAGSELRSECPFGARYVIWERRADDEHALTRRLAEAPDPIAVIDRALSSCVSSGGDALRCQPVRRAVQRSMLDLQRADRWDAAVEAFRSSPTAVVDEELLRREPGWAARAAVEIESLLLPR